MSEDYWEHVAPFWDSVNIHDGAKTFLRHFTEMPEHSAHLYVLHWCASEICNGGFDQFFFNSTGVLAPEAVAAFRAVGMPQTAAIIAEAVASLGTPYPREREERQDALSVLEALTPDDGGEDDWQSPFDSLDDRFYDLMSSENGGLEEAAQRYAAQFPIPDGPLSGTNLLNRLLGSLQGG